MGKVTNMEFIADIKRSELGEATLEWGIKESFRTYFERLPDHRYDLSAGARRCSDGQVEFVESPEPAHENKLSFRGTVQLTAHFGALSVKIAHPTIEFGEEAGRGVLSAEIDEKDGEPVRMVIAELFREAQNARSITFRAELAEEGQYLFMGNYFAGDSLDPLTVWFPGT